MFPVFRQADLSYFMSHIELESDLQPSEHYKMSHQEDLKTREGFSQWGTNDIITTTKDFKLCFLI